jgi:peptidoglycan biosynthesis protein MviN/MurJ (putative lipid II flippase)
VREAALMRKQLISVGVLTAIGQLAAFFKVWVTARLFGVGAELDGYNLALVMPTLVSGVLSGMVQTGLFPVRAHLATHKHPHEVAAFERLVLLILLLIGLALSAMLWTARGMLEPWIAPGATPAALESFRHVWAWAVALVVFNAIGDGMAYLLALRNRYPSAAASTIANALVGAAILLAWPGEGVLALAISTVAGLGVQVALSGIALRSAGLGYIGPLLTLQDAWPLLKKMGALGGWILPGVFFSNLTLTLPVVFLASHGEGAVAAFGYAQRFHTLVQQLLITSVSSIILAKMSELVAEGNEQRISHLLKQGGRLAFIVGSCAVFAVWLIGTPLLAWLFGSRFDQGAALRVSQHWLWLTIGLAPAVLGNVYAKLWQARGRAAQLSFLAGVGLTVFWAVAVTAGPKFGELAIPAGLSGASGVILLAFWFRERLTVSVTVTPYHKEM